MPDINFSKYFLILFVAIGLIAAFIIVELLIIRFNGTPVPVPDIPRTKQVIGSGPPLTYLIFGDSTAVGQGAAYKDGIASATAHHLAKTHKVTYQNFGVSGSRVTDVLSKQLDAASNIKPDIVLLSVGANDVTHLTPLKDTQRDMDQVIKKLKEQNQDIKIIITGSPEMGSVPRFPQPARYLAKLRTAKVNEVIEAFEKNNNVMFAPIAEETGPMFIKDPSLFAQDKFHPNSKGYTLWTPVLIRAIDISLK